MKNNNIILRMKNSYIFNMRSFAVLFLIIGFLSCESNSISELGITEETEDTEVIDVIGGSLVTYNGRAKAILDGACVECHSAGDPTSGVALDTYASAILFVERGLSRMMNGQSPMPPSGRIDADLIADIESWINDGLLEN